MIVDKWPIIATLTTYGTIDQPGREAITHDQRQAQENMILVASAGKYVISGKGGKTCHLWQTLETKYAAANAGKTFNQWRENGVSSETQWDAVNQSPPYFRTSRHSPSVNKNIFLPFS